MRCTGVRAVVVGLCLATLAMSGCSAKHAHPAARRTPSASAPTSSARPNVSVQGLSSAALADGYAGLALRCRAQITDGRLAAPFWLQFDHFDPARGQAEHSAVEVANFYRTSPQLQAFQRRRVQVAYADYTNLNGRKRPTVPVWLIVGYRVTASSHGLMSKPMKVDQVSIVNDSDLRPRSTIEALPSRCD